jgi:segregation and condensation protein A
MVLIEKLQSGKPVAFEKIFEGIENRLHAIFAFLSVLELIQEQPVKITIGEGYNNFWIEKNNPTEIEVVVLEGQEN